jgi:hypothetical protein
MAEWTEVAPGLCCVAVYGGMIYRYTSQPRYADAKPVDTLLFVPLPQAPNYLSSLTPWPDGVGRSFVYGDSGGGSGGDGT